MRTTKNGRAKSLTVSLALGAVMLLCPPALYAERGVAGIPPDVLVPIDSGVYPPPSRDAGAEDDAPVYFIRGDADGNGDVELTDAISILNCLFLGTRCSSCVQSTDVNGNGEVDMTDAIHLLGFQFLGGAPPEAPYPSCGRAETSRGALACRQQAPCVVPEAPSSERTAEPSALLYAARAVSNRFTRLEESHEHEDEEMRTVPRGTTRMPADTEEYVPWTSDAARQIARTSELRWSADLFRQIVPQIEFSDGLCTEPTLFGTASSSVKSYGVTFKTFRAAFATDASAFLWLKSLRPRMPFYLPFRASDVALWQGWLYGGGTFHRSIDYGRSVPEDEDSTFRVYAPAAGEVIAKYWSGGGNTLVIRHTAPNGQQYITAYLHMRDGRSNDLAMARATSCDATDTDCNAYVSFAEDFSDHVSWGKEWHTIRVEVGDFVQSGQLLGWAGNTGVGGASAGLNADGSPWHPNGNVHLHFSMAVAHPTEPNTFVWIDPYGVYGKVDGNGCYDFLKDTDFARFFAPFYPSFHGLPIEVLSRYFHYYTGMGWGLRTISAHWAGNRLLVSGAYGAEVHPNWRAHLYITGSELQSLWDTYWPQGLVIREMTVVRDTAGNPRFSAIWRLRESGEGVEVRANLTPAAWNEKWEERVVDDGWRVEDYFAYTVGGQEQRASVFTSKDARPFYFYHSLTSQGLSDILEQFGEAGYVPVNVSAAELPQGTRFSVALRRLSGCWKIYWGMTPAGYQSIATTEFSKGYRVLKVQGYNDSSRYLALFYRNGTASGCP